MNPIIYTVRNWAGGKGKFNLALIDMTSFHWQAQKKKNLSCYVSWSECQDSYCCSFVMESKCSFSKLVGGICDYDKRYPYQRMTDSFLPIRRSAFLLLVCLASPAGTRHRFAPLRHPIPKLERCAGQTVHVEILLGKENVEALARICSTLEETSLIPPPLTYSPIDLSDHDRGTVSPLRYRLS